MLINPLPSRLYHMASNASFNVTYLEGYIESTAQLPAELQRILNTIKVLDERSVELSDTIMRAVEAFLALPQLYKHKGDEALTNSIKAAEKEIQDKQAMLLQFADEKVGLAQHAYDLLELHCSELLTVLDDFEGEFKANGQFDLEFVAPYSLGGPPTSDAPRRSHKGEIWDGPNDTPTAGSAPRKHPPGSQKSAAHKRIRELDDGSGTPHTAGRHGHGPAHTLSKRKTNQAMGSMAVPGGGPVVEELAGGGGGEGSSGVPHGDEQVALSFINAPPAGLKHAHHAPQVPGRLLTHNDINDELRERHAELYWPADGLWYLIEIQSVDIPSKKAGIVYFTGETEELDLDEIINEGHLSLMPKHGN